MGVDAGGWQAWVPQAPPAPVPALTGPDAPLPLLAAVPALPVVPASATAALWVVGAHGGAGESSVAALVDGWVPTDHVWPDCPQARLCVLTARTSADGLLAAQAALRQWAAGDTPVDLAGLVLIADAPGRLPRPLRELADLISGGAPRTWHLPWIEDWRLGQPAMPRTARRIVDDLTAIATEHHIP